LIHLLVHSVGDFYQLSASELPDALQLKRSIFKLLIG